MESVIFNNNSVESSSADNKFFALFALFITFLVFGT